MNILMVATKFPYPANDGASIVIFETLKRLAGRGTHLTLLCFSHVQSVAARQMLEQFCRVETVAHDTHNHLTGAALNLFSQRPYNVAKYHAPKMAARLTDLLGQERFDLVQLEQLHLAHYAALAHTYGAPVALRQHNVESQLLARFAETQHGVRRVYARWQADKLRRYEARMCAQVDACLAISPADAATLRRLNPQLAPVVVPAGVDTQDYRPGDAPEEAGTLVSVASMDWPPNIDGALWFCRQVWPDVRRMHPQARFYIVGKNPPPAVQALDGQDGIIVTGLVDDVRPYIARAAVFVAPLLSGGGIRIKLLQAMAMGKAIVSTTVGADGIPAVNDEHLLLADDPAAFAASIHRLLAENGARRRLGDAARRFVEAAYGWDSVIDTLEQVYRGLRLQPGMRP